MSTNRKLRILGAVAIVAAFLIYLVVRTPIKNEIPLTVLTGNTMGTTYSVKFGKELTAKEIFTLKENIDRLLVNINNQMSTYMRKSLISTFNNSRPGEKILITEEFLSVLGESKFINEWTHGAFDVTLGPLVNLWGFGPKKKQNPPPQEAIDSLLPKLGMENLIVKDRQISKRTKEVQLDFSGVAKGYAVDQVSELLKLHKIYSHLVEIGGEVVGKGFKTEKTPWTIGIESPENSLNRKIKLLNLAIATSGDYRNYYTHQGKRLSHTLDPRTGRPITHSLASVSVLTESCMRSDALATALMVMGPDKGPKFAEENGLAAYFIIRDGENYRTLATSAFNQIQED